MGWSLSCKCFCWNIRAYFSNRETTMRSFSLFRMNFVKQYIWSFSQKIRYSLSTHRIPVRYKFCKFLNRYHLFVCKYFALEIDHIILEYLQSWISTETHQIQSWGAIVIWFPKIWDLYLSSLQKSRDFIDNSIILASCTFTLFAKVLPTAGLLV